MPMLVKKVRRMFHKNGPFYNKKNRWQEKQKDKEEGLCYNCKKLEYLIADCPENEKQDLHIKEGLQEESYEDYLRLFRKRI